MKTISLIIVLIATLCSSGYSQKLHAIIFADTKDAKIGDGCEKVYNLWDEEFTIMSKYADLELVEHYYTGESCTKANIDKMLKSLQPGEQDVVFFVFSGHGYNTAEKNYPTIVLHGPGESITSRQMHLADIYHVIDAKSPRLMVVINQSCNKGYGNTDTHVNNNAEPRMFPTEYSETRYKELLLGTTGRIIITSSRAGQYSYMTSRGGYFIEAFFDGLRKQVSTERTLRADWAELLTYTKTETRLIAEANQREQIPAKYSEIEFDADYEQEFNPPSPTPDPYIAQTFSMSARDGHYRYSETLDYISEYEEFEIRYRIDKLSSGSGRFSKAIEFCVGDIALVFSYRGNDIWYLSYKDEDGYHATDYQCELKPGYWYTMKIVKSENHVRFYPESDFVYKVESDSWLAAVKTRVVGTSTSFSYYE